MTDFKLENGFRKIYFEITKVGNDNTIEVYPEDPAYPPQPLMTFRRRGNFTDETRQNSIRLSSHDQIIEMLSGVNSYDVTWKNRDILIGKIKDLSRRSRDCRSGRDRRRHSSGRTWSCWGTSFK